MKKSKQILAISMGLFLSFSSIIGYGVNDTKVVSSDSTISSQESYKTNDMLILNEDSNGKEIVMTRGQMIKLSLKQDDDKYWAIAKNMNISVVRSKISYTTQEPGKIMNEVFRTIGEGTSVIEFGYFSSSTNKEVGNFKVTITVKQPDGMVVVDESFNGKEVVLKKGDKLKVAYFCIPGSLYPNCINEPDSSILNKIDDYSQRCPLEPYPVATGGGFGYKYFVYEAIGVGTTGLRFGYPNRDSDTKFTVKVLDELQRPSYNANDMVILDEGSNGKEIAMTRGQMVKVSLKQDADQYWKEKYVKQNVLDDIYSYTLQESDKIMNKAYRTVGEGTSVIEYDCYSSSTNSIVGNFKVTITVKNQEGIIVADESFNGKEVVLKKGDKLKVALYYFPGAIGDRCKKEPDNSILKEIDDYLVKCELHQTVIPTGGSLGYIYYVYEAIGVGTTDIKFGSGNSEFDKSFTIKVIDDGQTTPTATPTNKPRMNCDTNNDGVINMADIMPIAVRFNTTIEDKLYDEKYDFNKDGAINMSDVMLIAQVFGTIVEIEPTPNHYVIQ